MKTIEEQITLQGNQAKLYDTNIKVALARVGILEKENKILSSELKDIRAILCQSTSLKARVSLLERLSPGDQLSEAGIEDQEEFVHTTTMIEWFTLILIGNIPIRFAAKKIDVFSRVLFPGVFAVFNFLYWAYFLTVEQVLRCSQ